MSTHELPRRHIRALHAEHPYSTMSNHGLSCVAPLHRRFLQCTSTLFLSWYGAPGPSRKIVEQYCMLTLSVQQPFLLQVHMFVAF